MALEPVKAQSGLKTLFSFPHPVNEYAARSVAAMIFTITVITIATDVSWLTLVLVYSFLAHVLAGPRFSPIGTFASRVIAPKVLRRDRPVAGPPKQFAQSVGLLFSTTAAVLIYGFGLVGAAQAVLGVLALFAALEAFAGFCAGCFVFGYLMQWGLIPKEICERCNNFAFDSGSPTKGS
ncbi:MAG: protein of unknown function (DUF4395) [Chloroflexi bacterium]|jgi:hypothetical protein|nr:MAG: protein of unknown function (DUF4395) [Chloroflexota bacterium]